MRLEKSNIPANLKSKFNTRFRNFETDLDSTKRKLETYTNDRSKLFGDRYTDNPDGAPSDVQLEQRQQLLSGTDRLNRSSGRLRESQRIALETEQIGASTLGDLHAQREQITNTRERLLESESYTDRSIKTLIGMARRYVFTPDSSRSSQICAPWAMLMHQSDGCLSNLAMPSALSLFVREYHRDATNRIM